jgi:hypothetical protein
MTVAALPSSSLTHGLPGIGAPGLECLRLYRFTVEQYQQLIRSGILGADDRVELLEGWIVQKMSRNPPHESSVDRTQEAVRARVPAGWRVRVQAAIELADSQPEPDIAIVAGPADRYDQRHPRPQDVALVVEIADSTLLENRKAKAELYARAALPIYWIVNLVDRRVEVYSDPAPSDRLPAYRRRQDYNVGEQVPLVLSGEHLPAVPVDLLLPGASHKQR